MDVLSGGPAGPRHRGPAVWLPLAGLAILLLLVGPRHEPWFDEAQAWLIARDSTLWDLVARQVRYEGTPALWHVLLWGLIRLGLPYGALWMVSGAFALGGATVVLRRAPFPAWLRVATVFSYFFAYQYAVVARSYAVDLLLVPLIAVRFARRGSAPIGYALMLGAMASANAHGFIIAAMLGLEWAWHCRHAIVAGRSRLLTAIILCGAIALAAVAQAWPASDGGFLRPGTPIVRAVMILCEAFIDRLDPSFATIPSDASQIGAACLSLILLMPALKLFHRSGRLWLFLAIAVLMILFSILKYANAWHAGFLWLAWLLALWTSWPKLRECAPALRRQVAASTALILGYSCCMSGAALARDYLRPYSGGRAAAAALRAGGAPGPIAAFGFKSFAVQPYFDRNVFADYAGGAGRPSFYSWRRIESFAFYPQEADWLRLSAEPRIGALLLPTETLDPPVLQRWTAGAAANGFCLSRRFPGALIWKSYAREDDSLLLFTRQCTKRATTSR